MTREQESLIIVVSAPSGSGKTTLVNRLLKEVPGIRRSVSYTTRQPREGETDKEDYLFISREEFRKRIDNGEFLEWEEVFGEYYGTSRAQFQEMIEEQVDTILSIDVKGARTVKEHFPESISVFIMPPSTEELKARLRKRNTDQKEQVSLRLQESCREIASVDEYDYMVVNENLKEAVGELKIIIEAERKNRKNNKKDGE
jgi:guanylate kinase